MNLEHVKNIRWFSDIAYLMSLINEINPPKNRFRTFCECGVGPMDISSAPYVYQKKLADKLILVEPNPKMAAAVPVEIPNKNGMPKVELIRKAIGFKGHCEGQFKLKMNNGSSYVDGTWSPTPSNGDIVDVDLVPFSQIDDGKIDAMVLDCEGMEWAVLDDMVSRPQLLSVEIWKGHPHYEQIFNWLNVNRYIVRFSTGPEGETLLCERIS